MSLEGELPARAHELLEEEFEGVASQPRAFEISPNGNCIVVLVDLPSQDEPRLYQCLLRKIDDSWTVLQSATADHPSWLSTALPDEEQTWE
jgi:hypothetical protein